MKIKNLWWILGAMDDWRALFLHPTNPISDRSLKFTLHTVHFVRSYSLLAFDLWITESPWLKCRHSLPLPGASVLHVLVISEEEDRFDSSPPRLYIYILILGWGQTILPWNRANLNLALELSLDTYLVANK